MTSTQTHVALEAHPRTFCLPSPSNLDVDVYTMDWIVAYQNWACCDEQEALDIFDECYDQDTLGDTMWCECGEHGHNGDPQDGTVHRIPRMTIEDQHDRAIEHLTSIALPCEEVPPRYTPFVAPPPY